MAGRKGKSGRKTKAEEFGLRALLDECWSVQSRKKCFNRLAERAEEGDMEATKLLIAYYWGKPRESVEHSGGVEIRIIDESDS